MVVDGVKMPAILVIDEGTTSTRAMLFDEKAVVLASHQIALKQSFPNDAWVEHDPNEIVDSTILCCKNVLTQSNFSAKNISAIGITNQRETTIVWNKKTGEPIYPAIVWQDRRTADVCKKLSSDQKIVKQISDKTGLIIDSYFSATKISWILDHVEHARIQADNGELLFGTIDCYLIWKLTNGKKHVTDITNASRTLLFNIREQKWDKELLAIFNIPEKMLPTVLECVDDFGVTDKAFFGSEIPIRGVAGDQQAALIGQGCFSVGDIKSTYGTGCFIVLNTGDQIIQSQHQLLSTIAYKINHKINYALEGSIFSAGAGMQWLHENLNFMSSVKDSEQCALTVKNNAGVYFVPALTGLGAPYWDPNARGAIVGLTRDTQIAHIVRAGLEAVCYQTHDLLLAMQIDFQEKFTILNVDGGMSLNNFLLQFLADISGLIIERPNCIESTALGAAFLAGLGAGIYTDFNDIKKLIAAQQELKPSISIEEKEKNTAGWNKAIQTVLRS